jgi:hypothetical protein
MNDDVNEAEEMRIQTVTSDCVVPRPAANTPGN